MFARWLPSIRGLDFTPPRVYNSETLQGQSGLSKQKLQKRSVSSSFRPLAIFYRRVRCLNLRRLIISKLSQDRVDSPESVPKNRVSTVFANVSKSEGLLGPSH